MESTTRTKPRILFTGAATGKDFNALKDVGEVSVKNAKDGLEHAEVLWVDCATTKPDQYESLLRTALDAGKMLVLSHPDAAAHQALSGIVGCQVDGEATALMISRDMAAATPSCYSITALGGAEHVEDAQVQEGGDGDGAPSTGRPSAATQARPPVLARDEEGPRRDWASLLESHRTRTPRSVGGPGLIPPSGVMYGMRTLNGSFSSRLTNYDDWAAASGRTQDIEYGFTSSFYVYRENGKTSVDYVVIRVQEATFSPGTFMVNVDNAKGFWQFDLHTECTNNRNVALLNSSPGTTNGPGVGAQISMPLHVKYVQEGSCVPNYWSAAHGPTARSIEAWALLNQSSNSSGVARWRVHHRDFWNSQNDPPEDFGRWWSMMYDGGYGGRVKTLSSLARSSFTIETVSAWRFSASVVASNPSVTFREALTYRLAAFANPKGTGRNHRIAYPTRSGSNSISINLVSATDISSPCR
ncbi:MULTISPECIES: hypothetical protein [Myxococcus]|uniref:hypothetical protein n=1 Tax=Myxococcus TaxID=32 RepID=UPI0013D6FDE9|nr:MULTISPECIES: hypothetical protein [Myxococcus]NVJ27416.1 hypothetical protein [Myxococcus sp. AM011]